MKYQYYPGCSLEGTALEYQISTRAVMEAAGHELMEIEDWTCCGASAAESLSHFLSLALPARILALAEKTEKPDDILVPCSACYLNLKKVEEKIKKDPGLLEKMNEILSESGLTLKGKVRVRHLLDVMANDVGAKTINSLVKKRLERFSFAPYYGCQCLRPYAIFDDPESPRSMEPLIEATGARIHKWAMGSKCCGASHINTDPEVSMELVRVILMAARGADAIVTVCPMCQMNLEAYQGKISKIGHEDLHIPVLYLSQVIGLSLGLQAKDVRLDLNLSVTDTFCKILNTDITPD